MTRGQAKWDRVLEDGRHPGAALATELLERCISIDLQVDPKINRIQSFAGVRRGEDAAFVFRQGNVADALQALDDHATPASFLLGHNFIVFDAPHLAAASPGLRLLAKPVQPAGQPISASTNSGFKVRRSSKVSLPAIGVTGTWRPSRPLNGVFARLFAPSL